MKDKTAAARQARHREKLAASGKVRRDYYATPAEHEQLKAHLRRLRGG